MFLFLIYQLHILLYGGRLGIGGLERGGERERERERESNKCFFEEMFFSNRPFTIGLRRGRRSITIL